jgi:adenylate cyclase
MFTDFVGFTTSAEKLAAEELVALLHEYFTAFDEIARRHGIEKMKTVGDSYMCIGGLPVRNPSHPVDTVLAALEMVQFVSVRHRSDLPVEWAMRVGIHTGPVVAGVVGTLKFAFDVWGDTVNFASRMESSGVPNRVNISERTYARVKDFFSCEHRGKIYFQKARGIQVSSGARL